MFYMVQLQQMFQSSRSFLPGGLDIVNFDRRYADRLSRFGGEKLRYKRCHGV
jgi:hypothetical protein